MIGIITYHSAYNFGSTLQAYATQEAIKKLGYDCEIINYRLPEQKYYYEKQIRFRYGIKSTIKDILQLQNYKKRKIRAQGYERFISNYMQLSQELSEPSEVVRFWNKYDIIVSGSDQIWNKHSNELHQAAWEYMHPYTLCGFNNRKVSYASSIGNMCDQSDVEKLIDMIKSFDAISFRETKTAEQFSKMMGRDFPSVLDPTFLLSKEEWIEKLKIRPNENNYILYYSLAGINGYKDKMKRLSEISSEMGTPVVVVTPLVSYPINYSGLMFHPEFSTLDFMNAIYNAKVVITDSFHGSILSVNFGKDVYSICGENKSDFRKTDIFNRLGLNSRIISGLDDQTLLSRSKIEYDDVYRKIQLLKNESYEYLINALGG